MINYSTRYRAGTGRDSGSKARDSDSKAWAQRLIRLVCNKADFSNYQGLNNRKANELSAKLNEPKIIF